jgi:hypothetical protein
MVLRERKARGWGNKKMENIALFGEDGKGSGVGEAGGRGLG